MATAHHGFNSWTAGPGEDFPPGAVHSWWMTGFGYGDFVNVTAHPLTSENQYGLAIENLRIVSDSGGRTMLFDIRNIGPDTQLGYGVGFGWISE